MDDGGRTGDRPQRLELADVIAQFEADYRRQYSVSEAQDRALRELQICRTAAMGGHINTCNTCGHESQAYNSCRNRNCPRCQDYQRQVWLDKRLAEVLPVQHHHLVFTLPREIALLAANNALLIYGILFKACWQTLREYGRRELQLELGCTAVLHSWGQLLNIHTHIHVLLIGGGLTLDGGQWVPLPEDKPIPHEELATDFRKRFVRLLRRAYRNGELIFGQPDDPQDMDVTSETPPAPEATPQPEDPDAPDEFEVWLAPLEKKTWIVHSEVANRSGSGATLADATRTIRYLARYASGVALHNSRLRAMDESTVTFSYKDYRDGSVRKEKRLDGVEFLGRFLQHVLPSNVRHIRNYGFLAPNHRTVKLELIREQLGLSSSPKEADDQDKASLDEPKRRRCPKCAEGELIRGAEIPRPTLWQIMTMPLWCLIGSLAPPDPPPPIQVELQPLSEPLPQQLDLSLKLDPFIRMPWGLEYG